MVAEGAAILRRLARDQWVRMHGTPRVTVLAALAGDADARALWQQWIAVREAPGTLLEGDVDQIIRKAVSIAVAEPLHPIAVLAPHASITQWRTGRTDRFAAMVDEGLLVVARGEPDAAYLFDARSAAEAALYEALEATPATQGRFELNENLSVRFGSRAAEIDLLSRRDRIAIELDGIHHFADLDCYRRDRRKDVLMQTQGLFVLRFLAEDVLRDPREAVNTVCQALAYRLGERG
jgi:very-short-patch-repair endonuclease